MRITLSCGYSPSYRPPTMTHDDQNKQFLCQNPPEMSCHSVLFMNKKIINCPLCICQFFIRQQSPFKLKSRLSIKTKKHEKDKMPEVFFECTYVCLEVKSFQEF